MELNESLGLTTVLDSKPPSGALDPSAANRQGSSTTTSSTSEQSSPATQIGGTRRLPLSEPSLENSTSGKNVMISMTPDSTAAALNHPSNDLNKLLLQRFPACRMVISHDEDWCSVLKTGEETFPDSEELLERVMASHDIRVENDVLFLDWKEGASGEGIMTASSRGGTTLSKSKLPARTGDVFSPSDSDVLAARLQHIGGIGVPGSFDKELQEWERSERWKIPDFKSQKIDSGRFITSIERSSNNMSLSTKEMPPKDVKRVPMACNNCRQKRLSCRKANEMQRECSRCIENGLACEYSSAPPHPAAGLAPSPPAYFGNYPLGQSSFYPAGPLANPFSFDANGRRYESGPGPQLVDHSRQYWNPRATYPMPDQPYGHPQTGVVKPNPQAPTNYHQHSNPSGDQRGYPYSAPEAQEDSSER